MPGPGCRSPPVPHYTGPLLLRESARALLAARESGHPEWTGPLDLGRSLDTVALEADHWRWRGAAYPWPGALKDRTIYWFDG